MSRGKRMVPPSSSIVVRMFQTIPPKDVSEILEAKKSMFNRTRDHIRLQINLSKEAYAILKYWSALDNPSESGFFSSLANEYITRRIAELGLDRPHHINGAH